MEECKWKLNLVCILIKKIRSPQSWLLLIFIKHISYIKVKFFLFSIISFIS